MENRKLSPMEVDAIGEILNISLGASATAVSTMLDARVDITTPVVEMKTEDVFEFRSLEPAVCVEITYVEGLTGSNIMLLKREDVKVIVEMLMGMEIPDDEFELDEMNMSAICEVMNQMMGASSTALSELLLKTVNISTPKAFEVKDVDDFKKNYFSSDEPMVVVSFNLKISDRMESEFINLMPFELAKELVAGFFPGGVPDSDEYAEELATKDAKIQQAIAMAEEFEKKNGPEEDAGGVLSQEAIEALLKAQMELDNSIEESKAASTQESSVQEAPAQQMPVQEAPVQQMPMQQTPIQGAESAILMQMKSTMEMLQSQIMLQQQQIEMMKQNAERQEPRQIKVNPVPQKNLVQDDMPVDPDANVDLIMGVALDVSVEIGRTKKMVKDILEFNRGSLVVLDKLAGEQVDIYVNGECIAKGDVVVVEDNFGVRITEILRNDLNMIQ